MEAASIIALNSCSGISGCIRKPVPVFPAKRLKLRNPCNGLSLRQSRSARVSYASSSFSSSRIWRLLAHSSEAEESKNVSADSEKDKVKDDLEKELEDSEIEWKKTVDMIKDQASKMQGVSKEAYDIYVEKAKIVLQNTAEQLQVQAENAKVALSKNAEEFSIAGKENLSNFLENAPEPVKDVSEAFGAHPEDLKKISKVHDFCLGIPYGALLFVGGFLSFLISGSIPAVRFGVILGAIHLALSSSSLKAWKNGESSMPYVKGQAAIAFIILARELRVLFQKVTLFPGVFMTFLSAGVLIFYSYLIYSESKPTKDFKPEVSEG